MTKAELVEAVSRVSDLTRKHSEVIVEAVFTSIIDALQKGDKIELRGFGSFRVRRRRSRTGRNPKTGAGVVVPARRFRTSSRARNSGNSSTGPDPRDGVVHSLPEGPGGLAVRGRRPRRGRVAPGRAAAAHPPARSSRTGRPVYYVRFHPHLRTLLLRFLQGLLQEIGAQPRRLPPAAVVADASDPAEYEAALVRVLRSVRANDRRQGLPNLFWLALHA
jgi:integration host factor subunit beta